ncbi:MAG: 6-bladed beta-propeller [Planctomycetota bacterium]|jgi:DNA-binding beta-propeller fold protein YncE
MRAAAYHLRLDTLAVSVLLAVAGAGPGCSTPKPPEVHPLWPPAPARPRVAHLKNVHSASDLSKATFLARVSRAVTGSRRISLIRPSGVAVQEGRYLYVTDQKLQAVIVFDLRSSASTSIQRAGKTFFVSPVGVAACGDTVAVSDSALNTVYLLTPKGKLVRTLQKPGGFKRPTGLAWNPKNGLLYVVDTLANEICVFDPASGRLVRRFGSPGMHVGQFNYPTHIFADRAGKVYVTDSLNFRVQTFDSEGKFLFFVGKQGDATGHLAVPKGVGVDSLGHIYIVDSYFSTVQVFDQQGGFLLAVGMPGPGPGAFQVPTGLTVDSEDRIYVCDSYNNRVQILQYVGGTADEESKIAP